MKRSFARSRSLVLAVALTAAAAITTGYTIHAASPGGGAGAIRVAAYRGPFASDTPCSINYQSTTCQSTDPAVTVNNYFSGDQTGCSYVSAVTWGDGQSTTNVLYTDPGDGYDLLGNHTYAAAGTYTISVTLELTAGDCTANGFTAQFTLLPPPPTPTPVPTPSSPPPSPPSPPSQSNSWAGYVAANSGPYHHVQATWKMPGNKGTKFQEAITAFWVGFDGDTASPGNIEQCGAQILEASDGEIAYVAFYEVGLQAGAIKHPFGVHPGDLITAVANYAHGRFQCSLSVRHRGVVKTWSTGPIKGNFPLKTAEVITEAPGHPNIPLAPFGTVQYTNVDLGGNGSIYPVAMYTIDGLFEAVSTSPFHGPATKGSFSNQYIRSEVGL